MATLEEQLAALKAARASGEVRVRYADKEVEYRTVAELQAAIDRVQGEIDAASPSPPVRTVRTYAGRGT